MFTRLWVDTFENVVGVVEPLARAVFYDAVPDAAARVKGNWNVFQRLDDLADLFVASGHADLRILLDDKVWLRLQATWAIRHLFTHNDGVIDDKYIAKMPTSAAKLGRRATVTEPLCRQAIADAHILCTAIASITAEQTPPPS